MGYLTFVSKRLSAVGNKRISQLFDSAREPRSCRFHVGFFAVVVLYSYIVEYFICHTTNIMKLVKEKIERMDLTMARRPKGNYETFG